jgi:hypothetical protein
VQTRSLKRGVEWFTTKGIGSADDRAGGQIGAGNEGSPSAGPMVASTAAIHMRGSAHFAGGDDDCLAE